EALEGRWVPSTLIVDPTPGVGNFTSIQAAVTAAHNGDTIKVDPGTYVEQVTFNSGKSDINLIATSSQADSTVIQAPSSASGAIVDVNGASNIFIKGFKIDGGGNAAGTLDSGVRVIGGGSATIRADHITGLYNGSNNQTGYGVRVGQSIASTFGTAKVISDTIDNYQKG